MSRSLPHGLILLLLACPPAFAQRDLTDLPDPDPRAELASFQVLDGFEVNLWAAEPDVFKPIQMNWDAEGRLWVACSSVYPQIAPGQEANDQIIVLEDTDGDGTADSSTVFAEGLLIPTGILPGDGGCYVANSTEILHLSDTDGDGKADTRRVVLSGFGTEDTHHMIHTFRWGFDGLFY
ncbi:PVC-type heme-binding CxxCH protein, partial [Tautonia sp. JC769]|uniref:PVC-type heme-binding CxxCH protein n=1 Tax=Tautonia sp. JC769 TaxID=3232135 RepID=UPI003458A89C